MNSEPYRPIYRWKAGAESFLTICGSTGPSLICSLDLVGEVLLLRIWEYGIMIVDAENREFEGTDDFCTPPTHTFPES